MDVSTLFAGVVFGAIGFAAWRIGKRRQQAKPMVIGAMLMVFPYVVDGPLWVWSIGIALTFVAFYP